MKVQLCFDTFLNTKNKFVTENFLKTIRKTQLYQIHPLSINFKIVLLENSFQCTSDEENVFNYVQMLRWNRLLKMSSQKNIAFLKPCALEEETQYE